MTEGSETRRPPPRLAAHMLPDIRSAPHRDALENRKTAPASGADQEKRKHRKGLLIFFRPRSSPFLRSDHTLSAHYRGARPIHCGKTSGCSEPRLQRSYGPPTPNKRFPIQAPKRSFDSAPPKRVR